LPSVDLALIAASGAILLAAFTQGLTGFGFALVGAPLLLFVLEPRAVVITNTVLALVVCVLILAESWRHVRLRRIAPLLAGAVFGLPLGAYIISNVAPGTLKLAISGVIVVFAIPLLLGHRHRFQREGVTSLGAGFASGVLATSTSLGGPPVVLFLLNQGWGKEEMRASLSGYFFLLGLLSVASLAVAGIALGDSASQALYLLPALLAGVFVGSRLMPRVAADLHHRLSAGVIILTGLAGLGTGLAALL